VIDGEESRKCLCGEGEKPQHCDVCHEGECIEVCAPDSEKKGKFQYPLTPNQPKCICTINNQQQACDACDSGECSKDCLKNFYFNFLKMNFPLKILKNSFSLCSLPTTEPTKRQTVESTKEPTNTCTIGFC
jgi:hypothetical protein